MTNSENRNMVEMRGCIVYAKILSVLAVYAPDSRLVDCTVASPGSHRVLNEQQPTTIHT